MAAAPHGTDAHHGPRSDRRRPFDRRWSRAVVTLCLAIPFVAVSTGAVLRSQLAEPDPAGRVAIRAAEVPAAPVLPEAAFAAPSTTTVPPSPPPAPAAAPSTGAPRAADAPAAPQSAAPAPPAPTVVSGAAGELVTLINGLRASKGLAPYAVRGDLGAKAQAWAQSMAAAGQMSHQGDLAGGISAAWVRLGENVGVGPSVSVVHNAMLGSPTHHANLVDPGFSAIGVGVVSVGGTLYVAEEFMQV